MKIAYYISGHGYGHAVRSIEVIKGLFSQHPNIHTYIRTGAPQWLFDDVSGSRTTFYARHIEVGALQLNSFSVDKKATLIAAANLIKQKVKITNQEVTFLKKNRVTLVISDHTPLAFDAAHAAGIPAVGIANFSWDWIYADYLKEFPEFEHVITEIRNSYSLGDKLYRLPFYGEMPYKSPIIDVPLVGRKSTSNREETRKSMGLSDVKKNLVLLALKKQDLAHVNWDSVAGINNYMFIILSTAINQNNIINYNEGLVPFQDIVNACDAVISKPGYSMVSEILINKVPMLYVPREDFVEEIPLKKALKKYAVSQELSLKDFNGGLWDCCLDKLMEKPKIWKPLQADGAQVISKRIISEYDI